ncbi:MAG TPA: universal stress protein [Hyphomonadaceae bacterium]|nr:universal stress protein [Hyphomonadaceae bacterium]
MWSRAAKFWPFRSSKAFQLDADQSRAARASLSCNGAWEPCVAYKNILVHVDNTPAGKTRIAAAVALAKKFNSGLSGVFLRSELIENPAIGDGVAPSSATVAAYLSERNEEITNEMCAARRIFDEAVREAGVPFWWLDINGDSSDAIIACARRHDLVVLPSEMRPALGRHVTAAADVGMASGGPTLVLKHGGFPMAIGRKILIAWKDSRESARALRDAWPFLTQAEEIHFLVVSKHGESELDDLLQRHLYVHGCKEAKLTVDRDDEMPVGDIIRRHVGMTGADLVVLGLYGHSRLREIALGGVSRDLLSDVPMPLLLSH